MSGAIQVAAFVTGRPDAPPVLLSNSLGSTHRMWDPQVAELEKHFRIIRYDTRGHGDSPIPDGPYSIDDLVDDVIALLDRLEVESCHVVGLSLGGMTAMRLAARNPERVDRVVLLCTGAQLPPSSAWIDRAALVRERGSAAVAEGVVDRWFTADYRQANPDLVAHFQQMVADTPAEGYAGCCDAIAALDLHPDLPTISAATLAIAGADDPASPPAKLAEIVDAVPDSRLLIVEHACHLANVEQPQIVTPAIIAHLEDQNS